MKKNQKGFSAIEILIVLLFVCVIVGTGWYVWQKRSANTTNSNTGSSSSQSNTSKQQDTTQKLQSYTTDNEKLTFDFNPDVSAVKQVSAVENEASETYVVRTEITTGAVVLAITTGIDGIGGGPRCMNEGRDTCKVIDTKNSSYLGQPVTYRLVEAKLAIECGGPGDPSCDEVPLTTMYFIDTASGNDDNFGPCCGTLSSDAKNIGKKTKIAGSVLVDILPSKEIEDVSLLKNSDLLETIKIIETLRY